MKLCYTAGRWPRFVRSPARRRQPGDRLARRERRRRRPRRRPASASSGRCATCSTCRPAGSPATGAIGLLVPELDEPDLPRARAGDGGARDRGGLASILCNTTAAAFREVGLRAHAARARRRRDDLHLLRDDEPRAASTTTTRACVEEGARLVFVNGALEDVRRPVGRRRRAARRLARDAAPDRPRPPADRLRRRARRLPPDAREGGGPREALCARQVSTPNGLRRARRLHASRRAGSAARAMLEPRRPPDGRDLLERPDRDRRPPGGARSSACACRRTSRSSASTGSRRRRGVDPPLTTIEQPIDEIAATAVELLRTVIAEPAPLAAARARTSRGSVAAVDGAARGLTDDSCAVVGARPDDVVIPHGSLYRSV